MAVLVEAISVLVRKDSVVSKMAGGEERFRLLIPNATYCDDGEIARVGFLNPADVGSFIDELEDAGLTFLKDGKCVDLAVCDQQKGLTADCDWIEFWHIPWEDGKIASAWLFEGERRGHGMHLKSTSFKLVTPLDWEFKGSLSDKFHFVPADAVRH